MAKLYTVEPGYQDSHSKAEAWDKLHEIVQYAVKHPYNTIALELDGIIPANWKTAKLDEVYATYQLPERKGNPLWIHPDDFGRGSEYITISVSGGGEYRPLKTIVAQAMCRYIMRQMHKAGYDVSITTS